MIDSGLARGSSNQRIGRILRLFKWAASEEFATAGIRLALKTASGLFLGQTEAKESEPVRPVDDDADEAIRPHVARQVWAMIRLQQLTGMRPGEVTRMRTGDLDRSGAVWVYTPSDYKTAHHGRGRRIYLGPRAQEILVPMLREDPGEYLFRPEEAMAEFRARQRLERRTPLPPSQRPRPRKSAPKYAPGERYSTRTYYHAVQYGCRRAGIPPWHPNQLRHGAATAIRARYGLEAAQVTLGHAQMDTSEIYAEKDEGLARRVAAEVG